LIHRSTVIVPGLMYRLRVWFMGVRMDGSGNNISFSSSSLFCLGKALYSFGVVCEAVVALHDATYRFSVASRPVSSLHSMARGIYYSILPYGVTPNLISSSTELLHTPTYVSPCPSRSANFGSKRQMNQTSPAGSRVRRACLAAQTPLRVECQNRRDGYAMSACFHDSLVKHGQLRGTWTTAVSTRCWVVQEFG
jgi:hypothetical protein